MTNQEKQERFRAKESLKKFADKIFRDWQMQWGIKDFRSPKEVRDILDKIVALPSGWKDEDFRYAQERLNSFSIELYSRNPNLLQNDVFAGRDSVENLRTTNEPLRLFKEQKDALARTKKLSAHLISALDLSSGTSSDHAAALMEAVRHVGLILATERNIVPRSNATAVCLAMINPLQKKPEWLVEALADVLASQLGNERAQELGETLIKKSTKGIL